MSIVKEAGENQSSLNSSKLKKIDADTSVASISSSDDENDESCQIQKGEEKNQENTEVMLEAQ